MAYYIIEHRREMLIPVKGNVIGMRRRSLGTTSTKQLHKRLGELAGINVFVAEFANDRECFHFVDNANGPRFRA